MDVELVHNISPEKQTKQQAAQVIPLVIEIGELTGAKYYQPAVVTASSAPLPCQADDHGHARSELFKAIEARNYGRSR